MPGSAAAAHSAPDVDTVIIGAGVVGLACAAQLAQETDVIILEAREGFGQGASSRNSEVLHAGLYYKPGSLKSRLCRRGRQLILEMNARSAVPLALCGKVVIACSTEEIPRLKQLESNARACGVKDLRMLSAAQVRERVPQMKCVGGLFSPGTGILDSHALMDDFRRQALAADAQLLFQHRVTQVSQLDQGWLLAGQSPSGLFELKARTVVNAAGLYSDRVAALAGMNPERHGIQLRWNRGEYFSCRRWSPHDFPHLVYPLPAADDGHLGIHLTLDLAGALKFGPSAVEWPNAEDYAQDDGLAESFAKDLRRWLPDLRSEDLQPAGVGIRAKRRADSQLGARDFHIAEESTAGLAGWINLIGIESPGLTAAPAIAEEVLELWKQIPGS